MSEITNPTSGLTLIETMHSEQLSPANNLADVPDRALGFFNPSGHRTTNVSVSVAAGAANVCTVTVQAKGPNGANTTGVRWLMLITTSDAAGTTISGTAYSGTLAAVTGTIPITFTAKHAFLICTDATGLFVGSLTDTAKTADFIAVAIPMSGGAIVSTAMAFG